MAKNKQNPSQNETNVAEVVSKSEQFLEKYKNPMMYTVIALAVLVGAFFAWQKLIREPRHKEALNQMFTAEQYFRADSFALALNGDGNALGFADLIKEYGRSCGKAVYFYAGVSSLQLGQFQDAINYLGQYKAGDEIIQARAYCCTGDAYAGLNNMQEALNWYLKAAHYKDNLYAAAYYKKAGIAYEELGQKEKAIEMYKTIYEKYPTSLEGADIYKYITRLQ